MKKSAFVLAAAFAGFMSGAVLAADAVPDYVPAAVADTARPDGDRNADARRHPAELVAFAQAKPGDVVVDLIPGGGYFTRIFSKIVGPKGHVYAIWPDAYANEDQDDVAATITIMDDKQYSNVTVLFQPGDHFSVPAPADVVWTSQNYHDYPDKFMNHIDPAILNRQVLAALKPGGVFIVVDHVAEAGSGMRDTDTLHRIEPAIVKTQVTAAGFVFDGESNVLRNPKDDHKLVVFDKKIRGYTDQFSYRFRKPA